MPADLQKEEAQKTFYLETFGCQMNVHDSEKVIGTLISQGYRQVSTVEDAGLILYNTCSIRDKAEQKVFHRLADYKKLQAQGKKFAVLGCVAQQEGEKIFERAPHVSMVCGSASYRNLPQMLIQIEAGKRATGLDDRETDECFQTGSTRVLDAMQRLYTREQYLERISWMKAAKREISITTDIIVGFPGETEAEFQETLSLLDEVQYDGIFGFKYSPRPNTPALKLEDPIPDAEKARRLSALQEKQRDIQMRKNASNLGRVFEVMVEGKNEARAQWIGRTSQNKVVNFKALDAAIPAVGGYVSVVTTATFPNSLAGEMVI